MLLGRRRRHFTVSKFIGDTATGNATIADVNSDGIPDILSAGGFVLSERVTGPLATNLQYHFASCIYADFEKTNKVVSRMRQWCKYANLFHINPDGSFNLTKPLGSVSFAGSFQFTSVLQALDVNGDGILRSHVELERRSPGCNREAGPSPSLHHCRMPAGTTTATNYVTGVFSDLDGDGHPDLCRQGCTVSTISYGQCLGGFQCSGPQPVGTNLYTSTTSDFNGDNLPDVLTIGIPGINCRQGKGDGTFAAPVPVSLPSGYS